MDAKTLLKNAYAMPICTPAYPRYPGGKVRFYNREFMIITYRSDLQR